MDMQSQGENFSNPLKGDSEILTTQFIDSLAQARSFEHFLYDNRARRTVMHAMDKHSIIFNEEAAKTMLPEGLKELFASYGMITIEDLEVIHIEDTDYCDTTIKFSIEGDAHSLVTRRKDGVVIYQRPDTYGTMASYKVGADTPTQLLAAFLYMREYQHTKDTPQVFDLDESSLERQRIGDSDMIERIVMTLGHFDGVSQTTTECLVPIEDKIMVVNLTTTESPMLTHTSNDIDLSLMSDVDASQFEALRLSQQIADIKKFTGEDFNDQYGQIQQEGKKRAVTPVQHDDWITLCEQFTHTIQPSLTKYQYLDDTL